MRYWWVNHNQTGEAEVANGYLWSPKREINDARSQFYENMREVEIGDLVYSYKSQRLSHVGVVADHATTFAKPHIDSAPSSDWSDEGWLVPVNWVALKTPIRPKDFLAEIGPLLPEKYSPIRGDTGDGNQKAYLSEISEALSSVLSTLTETDVAELTPGRTKDRFVEMTEDAQVASILSDLTLSDTEKDQLVASRRGQGRFRQNLLRIERACRVTGVVDPVHLVASHIKPWRFCESGAERLDGNNGLLLTPNADRLFDRGLMTFTDEGVPKFAVRLTAEVLQRLGLQGVQWPIGEPFSEEQRAYLAFHRAHLFVDGQTE